MIESDKLMEKLNIKFGKAKSVSASEVDSEMKLDRNNYIVHEHAWSLLTGPMKKTVRFSSVSSQHEVLAKKRKLQVEIETEKVNKRKIDVRSEEKVHNACRISKISDGRLIPADVYGWTNSASLFVGTQKCIAMDSYKSRQCAKALQILMEDRDAWPFNKPVDPVLMGLADYSSVVTEPMDLGTIKKKLESKKYLSIDQFAADVMLTFSNAMRYNPPADSVHIMAKRLKNIFKSKWDDLESKWRNTTVNHLEKKIPAVEKEPEQVHVVAEKSSTLVKTSKPRKDMTTNFNKQKCDGNKTPKPANLPENLKLGKDVSNDSKKQGESSLAVEKFDPPWVQQFSSRAQRVAALKTRFASTILKAQLQKIDGIPDSAAWQKEREKCEKKQQEEKLRIEAQLAAANAAKLKAEKLQRERERAAARLALDKMERKVQDEKNWEFSNHLYKLDCPVVQYGDMRRGRDLRRDFLKLLNRRGYFLKDEDPDKVIDSWVAVPPDYDKHRKN